MDCRLQQRRFAGLCTARPIGYLGHFWLWSRAGVQGKFSGPFRFAVSTDWRSKLLAQKLVLAGVRPDFRTIGAWPGATSALRGLGQQNRHTRAMATGSF